MTPEFDDPMQHREWLLNNRIQEAVDKVYQLIFADDLSAAESKLGWMLVIEKMLLSAAIDRRGDVTVEWMGLKR